MRFWNDFELKSEIVFQTMFTLAVLRKKRCDFVYSETSQTKKT